MGNLHDLLVRAANRRAGSKLLAASNGRMHRLTLIGVDSLPRRPRERTPPEERICHRFVSGFLIGHGERVTVEAILVNGPREPLTPRGKVAFTKVTLNRTRESVIPVPERAFDGKNPEGMSAISRWWPRSERGHHRNSVPSPSRTPAGVPAPSTVTGQIKHAARGP